MKTYVQLHRRAWLIFVLAQSLLPVVAFVTTRSMLAEPNTPLAGGVLTVNDNGDNTTADSVRTSAAHLASVTNFELRDLLEPRASGFVNTVSTRAPVREAFRVRASML